MGHRLIAFCSIRLHRLCHNSIGHYFPIATIFYRYWIRNDIGNDCSFDRFLENCSFNFRDQTTCSGILIKSFWAICPVYLFVQRDVARSNATDVVRWNWSTWSTWSCFGLKLAPLTMNQRGKFHRIEVMNSSNFNWLTFSIMNVTWNS